MASHCAENELNLLPVIYDVIKSIEKESPEVPQKMHDVKVKLQKAKESIDKLSGIQTNKEDQLKKIEILRKQLILKTELLQKYKSLSTFDLES